MVERAAGSPLAVHPRLKKKKNKHYFKKAFDYLFSDDYLFSPLFSSHFSSSIGIEEPASVNDDDNKDFVEKVGDYLKSDCYLYSPLLHSAVTQTGLYNILGKEKRSKEGDKSDKPTEKIAVSVNKKQNSNNPSTINVKRTLVEQETVPSFACDRVGVPR